MRAMRLVDIGEGDDIGVLSLSDDGVLSSSSPHVDRLVRGKQRLFSWTDADTFAYFAGELGETWPSNNGPWSDGVLRFEVAAP
ncbi:hypothetical protein ACIBH1_45150 [Nonomuraea sp. NPDC050663]|uniref:hypothetical protein n=1 Tax=Nonomuraea sp. NPDC050663 TaxID=3364370 RepID=UPI00378AF1C8